MKLTRIVAVGALSVALSMTGFAQPMHGQSAQQEKKSNKMDDMMGKPTAERTVDGLRVQLWLIAQDEHKKMMEERMKTDMGGMKHDMTGGARDTMKMDHEMAGDMKGMDHGKMGKEMMGGAKEADHSRMMSSMKDGTHHVMVKILDDKSGTSVGEGHIMIEVTAPSGKSSMIHLSEMTNHFGGGASLTEKGVYRFALSFKVGKKAHETQFEYKVK